MSEKKLLIGFYKGSVEPYMNQLNVFEQDNYIIHIFDNVTDDIIENFNLENILINILGEEFDNNNINIISNMEDLIEELFTKYSLIYNSFIFDNSHEQKHNSKKIKKMKAYEYRSNLYSVKRWKTTYDYLLLKENSLYECSDLFIKNFINSVEEIFININEFPIYFKSINQKAEKINNFIKSLEYEQIKSVETFFYNTFDSDNILYKIYMGSFLLYTFKNKEYFDNFLKIIMESEQLNANNKFYIIYQLISKRFTDNVMNMNLDGSKLNKIYDDIFDEFKKKVGNLEFIKKEDRNDDFIIIFTSQYLTMKHGPTKTVLDRCYALSKYLNKKVMIINTRELITNKGNVPIYCSTKGNVIEAYSERRKVKYKDIEIEYYQPECEMPDEKECIKILQFIKMRKPYLLINIGGYSITADLASQMVPMATISTSGNYSISKNKGQFFIMGRKPLESDYEYIEKQGYARDSIIECPFTFELKPQQYTYVRKKFEIPEDRFTIAIIGARLEKEIDDDLLSVLDGLASKGCFIVTIGPYSLSNEDSERYTNLVANFKALGFQSDVLACIDLIDLYINPKRQGGGTSAVECMFKGKPALSLKYGDVSMLVDSSFLCDNYNQMVELVLECKNNKNLYCEISRRARVKAEDLMNTEKYFVKMYNDIINNRLFE